MKRPEEIREHIANIHQIESIVGTLQALAAAHQVEARKHLDAIRSHEATVAGALSVALAVLAGPPPAGRQPGPGLSILVGATQGFCGAYADRMAEAARDETAHGARLMVVGARTVASLAAAGDAAWTGDMAAHAGEIPGLASRLADALFSELARTPGLDVRILFANPADPALALVTRRLFPFDFSRFPPSSRHPPLMSLEPAPLVARLVEEYVFTELCEALMLGFAAENAARAAAMARAKANVGRRADELEVDFRRARQDQMTTEIIEVSAGAGR